MDALQRRDQILHHIQEHGRGVVNDFAKKYQVSTVTIRNDLNYLEKKSCIVRCYGGATLNEQFAFDRPLKDKGQINSQIKIKLAAKAAELIQDGDSIILDSGSTAEQIAKQITHKKRLIVMTNAINTAYFLTNHDEIEVMVTGGRVRKNSFSLHGDIAESQLEQFRFDKLFLGVDGFELESGITTPHSGEAQVNRKMCQVANKIIVVTDSSKFTRKSFCLITPANQIDVLITDNGIPASYQSSLIEMGVEVIIVE